MKRCFYVNAVILLVAVIWNGCGDQHGPVAPDSGLTSEPAAKPAQAALDAVMAVQDRHTKSIMALAGVVGTATGLGAGGSPVVVVFTEGPGLGGIPRKLEGVPVVVRAIGEIRALKGRGGGGGGGKGGGRGGVDPTSRFDRTFLPVPSVLGLRMEPMFTH